MSEFVASVRFGVFDGVVGCWFFGCFVGGGLVCVGFWGVGVVIFVVVLGVCCCVDLFCCGVCWGLLLLVLFVVFWCFIGGYRFWVGL